MTSIDDADEIYKGAEILLRFCEGAGVVLYRHRGERKAENVPSRTDLFQYTGGMAWGYGGTGPQALSFAIAGKLSEFENVSRETLGERARALLGEIISTLPRDEEHTLSAAELRDVFPA